jgi:hypothetical protein
VGSSGQKIHLLNHEKNPVFAEGVLKKFEEYFVNWRTHVPMYPQFVVLHQSSFVEIFKSIL